MKMLNNVKNKIEKLPEFSEANYSIVGYVFAAIITVAGGFLIYEVLSTDALTFSAQWNMFKSPLGSVCFFIGFIWAMLWWGKFTHWSSTPVIETRDRSTGKLLKREEDYDVIEQSFAKILMPILGHFVIEPLMYGAIIYYPIQCIIALVGAIFPYVISLIVLAVIAGAWAFTRFVQFRYRSALLVLCGVVFSVIFAWGGYTIMDGSNPNVEKFDQMVYTDSTNDEQMEIADSDNVDIEEEVLDDQFDGVGEEGLFGSLPEGTTEYAGDMGEYSIEFDITKDNEGGVISAVYKNISNSTMMNLSGESLPAAGGDINFYGSDESSNWTFTLTGDAESISGTAQNGDGNELQITLHRR